MNTIIHRIHLTIRGVTDLPTERHTSLMTGKLSLVLEWPPVLEAFTGAHFPTDCVTQFAWIIFQLPNVNYCHYYYIVVIYAIEV